MHYGFGSPKKGIFGLKKIISWFKCSALELAKASELAKKRDRLQGKEQDFWTLYSTYILFCKRGDRG
jgi:hypothetical protein